MVMARAHGHALQPRWTEGDWPPVQRTPPQAGLPSLERNHAYHCRMTPGVFLGARCNHGLSILLRLPVLDERQRDLLSGKPLTPAEQEERTVAIQESLRTMVQLIVVQRNFSCRTTLKSAF